MDTKLKKSNKVIFIMMYILFVVSAVMAVVAFVVADTIRWTASIRQFFWISDFSLNEQISIYIGAAVICAIIAAVSLVYLFITVGDRDEDGKLILKSVDKVYTEIQLIAIGLGVVLCGVTFMWFYNELTELVMVMAGSIVLLTSLIILNIMLSCARKIKAGTFFSQSIIGKLCILIYENVISGGSLLRKVTLITILAIVLSATIVFAPVLIILVFIFMPKFVREFEEIKSGIDEVRSGNLSYKIPELDVREFNEVATGINEISLSSNMAVQNEMKNQRMKAELISNVSHDLKTPLTSMVTYIDLLKTEGLTSENAPQYLDVLDQKTSRLRQLTEDLFEAAKASSGAIPVRKEKIDLLSLINQGLGEMEQDIAEVGLDIIIKAELEKYYVWADGQLLWRVVENLLGNVIKYTQENTRVYINITEAGESINSGMVVLEIKNISRQALNIEADELMERFKRGDESRTTEGSGLGLAIAKDLVKLQGGLLDIKIDGDLFKAVVMLAKVEE